jgi:hypothetical protein
VLTADVFVHGLEQAVSSARGGNATRLVELADGLIAANILSPESISGSPVLRDFFSENGAERLVQEGSGTTAATSVKAADVFSVADDVVGSGAQGEELAKLVGRKMGGFPPAEAAGALMRAVLKVRRPWRGFSPTRVCVCQ